LFWEERFKYFKKSLFNMAQEPVSLNNLPISLYIRDGFETLQKRLEKSGFSIPTESIVRFADKQEMIYVPYKREIKGSDQPAYASLAIPRLGNYISIAFWRQVDGRKCRTETEYVEHIKKGRRIIIPRLKRKSFSTDSKENERGHFATETFEKTIIYRKPIELPLDDEF